jgi:hypothetical protein
MVMYFLKSIPIGTTGVNATCWAIIAGTFQLGGENGPVYGVSVVLWAWLYRRVGPKLATWRSIAVG